MDWDALQQAIADASLFFVHDERDRDREKLSALRKLPALARLGFERTTHPKSWRKLDQWSSNQFEFEGPPYILRDDIPEQPTFDLVAISEQYYENEYPVYTLGRVINQFTRTDQRLIIATDDTSFQPAGARRPLDESPVIDETFDYKTIFDAHADRYEKAGLSFPLRDTRNLFLQDNAILYELVTGKTLDTVHEVFHRLPDAPYIPIWDTITDIFTTDATQGTRLLDQETQEGLAKWLRRRIEFDYQTSQDIAADLNSLARRRERMFNPYRRRRQPEMEDARETAAELNIDNAVLQKRYMTWLRGET